MLVLPYPGGRRDIDGGRIAGVAELKPRAGPVKTENVHQVDVAFLVEPLPVSVILNPHSPWLRATAVAAPVRYAVNLDRDVPEIMSKAPNSTKRPGRINPDFNHPP